MRSSLATPAGTRWNGPTCGVSLRRQMEAQIILMLAHHHPPRFSCHTLHMITRCFILDFPGKVTPLHRIFRVKRTFRLCQKKRMMSGTLIPTLVQTMLRHRHGPPESATPDLSRTLSAQLRGFLPKSSTRLGAPPASTSSLSGYVSNCTFLISLPSGCFISFSSCATLRVGPYM